MFLSHSVCMVTGVDRIDLEGGCSGRTGCETDRVDMFLGAAGYEEGKGAEEPGNQDISVHCFHGRFSFLGNVIFPDVVGR